MRRALVSFCVPLLATAAAAASEREYSTRTLQETLSFGAEQGSRRLVVDNVWGGIRIFGHDGTGVELRVVETIRAESAAKAERAASEVELETRAGGGEIDLYVAGPFRDRRHGDRWAGDYRDPGYTVIFDFELRVPRRCDLEVRTVNQGEIEIHDVAGALEARNVNGGILVAGGAVRGGVIRTVNGSIVGRFRAAPTQDLQLATVNGRIETFFPPSLAADLRLATTWGEIWSEFDVTPLPAPPPTRYREDGRLVIELGRGAEVRVGEGGPRLGFETLNGDILIRKEGPRK